MDVDVVNTLGFKEIEVEVEEEVELVGVMVVTEEGVIGATEEEEVTVGEQVEAVAVVGRLDGTKGDCSDPQVSGGHEN